MMIVKDSRTNFFRSEYHMLRGLVDLILFMPKGLQGTPMIEIGSYLGASTRIFSTFFHPVISIDPHMEGYSGMTPEEVHHDFVLNTKDHGVTHIRLKSDEAIGIAPDNVSMVYVDGDHSYEQVKRDIINYWPRVIDGGFLCGHDYGLTEKGQDGVKPAVKELFGEPDVLFQDTSWLIKKDSTRSRKCP